MPREPIEDKDAGWIVVEERFEPGRQRAQETVFSIGNGRFATRGSVVEGFRSNRRATLLHGIFAPHPLAHSELANLPDWTSLDVLIDGERFSLDSGEVVRHIRRLDVRCGVLERQVKWRSPAGRTVELRFERFASLARPHIAAAPASGCGAESPVRGAFSRAGLNFRKPARKLGRRGLGGRTRVLESRHFSPWCSPQPARDRSPRLRHPPAARTNHRRARRPLRAQVVAR